MKKKWTAALLSALLLVQLIGIPTQATENIYFIGVEENILPISDSTMPFWQNNYLYIPSSIFTGTARTSLKVGYSEASDNSWVALYQGTKALLFREGVNYGEDASGKILFPGAVKRNGQYFVPVATVASAFDLDYSVKKVRHGWLVWLRTKGFILSESQFADAAFGVMEQRYGEYIAKKTPGTVPEETPPMMSENPVLSGKKIYLCVKGNEHTSQLLDIMDRYHAQMTVFCTPDFMEENHDLLRRIAVTGHGIGILVDGQGEGASVLEQFHAGNLELSQATGGKTRLVRLENGTDELLEELVVAGGCPAVSQLNLARNTLNNSYQANLLFRSISSNRGNSVLWLGDAVQSGGLVTFLSQTVQQKERCLMLTETVRIP